MEFKYKDLHKQVTNDELIDDLKNTAFKLKIDTLSMKEYSKYGTYNPSTIIRRFGTWNNGLALANLGTRNKFYDDDEFLKNIETVWVKIGKQPTRRDMDNKELSNISSNAYLRKYGKWSNALKTFVNYVNGESSVLVSEKVVKEHKTTRDVNLRIRFIVMKRDNFKCCICGASPAKDPSVELHIDHIVPWSKGGETTIDNLQTLCSKCNLGKSNL